MWPVSSQPGSSLASDATFCAAITKAYVAVFSVGLQFSPRFLLSHPVQLALLFAAALCGISVAALSTLFPLRPLLPSVQLSMVSLLLHSEGVPSQLWRDKTCPART